MKRLVILMICLTLSLSQAQSFSVILEDIIYVTMVNANPFWHTTHTTTLAAVPQLGIMSEPPFIRWSPKPTPKPIPCLTAGWRPNNFCRPPN